MGSVTTVWLTREADDQFMLCSVMQPNEAGGPATGMSVSSVDRALADCRSGGEAYGAVSRRSLVTASTG